LSDVHFLLFDEREEEVKWSLKLFQVKLIGHTRRI
jgi:hypothetical protein